MTRHPGKALSSSNVAVYASSLIHVYNYGLSYFRRGCTCTKDHRQVTVLIEVVRTCIEYIH